MDKITIHACTTGRIIFEGIFPSLRHCLEAAVTDHVCLASANLAGRDLSNATLDGADLHGACLDGANLWGANVCEANMTGVSAVGSDFTLACLCESRLVQVNFRDAVFGGTLVTDALIEACLFSCPSVFSLPFNKARLGHNIFEHEGRPLPFATTPVVVTGLPQRIVFLDGTVLVGERNVGYAHTPFEITAALRSFCHHHTRVDIDAPANSRIVAGANANACGPVAELVDAHDLKS